MLQNAVTTEEAMPKDKEERRLSKIKIGIMRNPMFALWSGLMTVGKTSITDSIFVPTACTNGRDEMYGREFVKRLDDKELTFVVLHETLHKAYRHLTTWSRLAKQDGQLTNMACDYVINLQIMDMDKTGSLLKMPTFEGKAIGLLDERFRNMNVKQVYDILKDEEPEGGYGGGKGGMDDHDWEGAGNLTKEEAEALQREVDQAIRQGLITYNKVYGSGAGGLSRELGELLEPEVDWREVLREFVKATCNARDASSWRKVNRRFLGSGVYLPSLVGESVGHLVIGIDTSGSIGGHELNEFLTEVQAIADEVHPSKVDLLYWDSEVAGHEEYDQYSFADIAKSTKPMGGGGTNPVCVCEYLKEKNIKPEAIIMLTDGYVPQWGDEWEAPVLWTIVRNKNANPTTGKAVHIKEK
jgi:predicted metal-dependent peptidase